MGYPTSTVIATPQPGLPHMDADFSSQRTKMVDCQLRTTDVTNASILDAMGAVPRERFVGAGMARRRLYRRGRAGGAGARRRRTALPDGAVALRQAACSSPKSRPRDRVLDVGCATGYSAAVLSKLAASVVALESDPDLAAAAAATLAALGCDNVTVVTRPAASGIRSVGSL